MYARVCVLRVFGWRVYIYWGNDASLNAASAETWTYLPWLPSYKPYKVDHTFIFPLSAATPPADLSARKAENASW